MRKQIKGARAYYFRSIFHDWPGEDCVKIMKMTAEAMERGYSRMVIHEWVLPTKGVPLYASQIDLGIMGIVNGMERTERQWAELLERAGLKIVNIFSEKQEAEGMLVVELA
ncbi:S-adenosyl-L-methionine-dependent methyltransferase [Delitschia confertaspora ATCC 74209]|uniref:S-adenosyl-L-methionine-dependent methyltransferase n=1 Tax=Delitschia confertaspora ATCC 74209 TaxID=1513339 RepID=A0A9P4MMN5_9PLEO|nr:S-adenosyl-L-methionine-dependent methyltransferase [Delitschia confertaspora ATCC 74209]